MTAPTKRHAAVALFSLALMSASTAAAVSDPIGGYQFKNDVSNFLNIGLDLKAMDQLLSQETKESFEQALKIYQYGAYSDPYTQLSITNGIPFDLPKGTQLTGTDNDGNQVTVTTGFNEYKKGALKIDVLFTSTDPPCRFSGMPEPELDGCLVSDGELRTASGPQTQQPFGYSYALDDIRNYHKIQPFSTNAQSKFKVHGNTHVGYYKDFQKYVDYFGTPDFADQIIMAAFQQQVYTSAKNGFVLDFTQMSPQGRKSVILHTAAFMVISQFVIRELETAVVNCDHRCGPSDCNHDSIHALDSGVALYTGAIMRETGKGNLMYGLAEHMCSEFRTCGSKASSASGTAKINVDIFRNFQEMQSNLDSNQCLQAKINKETIAKQLFVPLLQATLLAIHMDQKEDTMETRAERVVFTTSILPLMHHCDPAAAANIAQDTDVLEPIGTDTFTTVKSELELKYRCMGVTCLDMGGLWDEGQKDYIEGAATCYVPDESSDSLEDLTSMIPLDEWYMYLLALSAVGLVVFCLMRRYQKQKQLLRELQDDDDSDSDDDFSDERPWA